MRWIWRCVNVMCTVLSVSACERGEAIEVRRLTPPAGHVRGGQTVKVIGRNLRKELGYTVFFGPREADAVTIIDDKTLAVTTPRYMDPGPVDVLITSDGGTAFRIRNGFVFQDAGGNVMKQVGTPQRQDKPGSQLAY